MHFCQVVVKTPDGALFSTCCSQVVTIYNSREFLKLSNVLVMGKPNGRQHCWGQLHLEGLQHCGQALLGQLQVLSQRSYSGFAPFILNNL